MNILQGEITAIKTCGSLSLVSIQAGDSALKSIVIESPETAPYLKEGNPIKVLFKETEVVIGKGTEHHLSLRNRLISTIQEIEKGELLSKLSLSTSAGPIISFITTSAVEELDLKKAEVVTAMVKTNEVMLSE